MADDDGVDNDRLSRGRNLSAAVDSVNVFSIMEDINDKLKILNYELKFCKGREFKPLTRTYFAMPGKASDQFPYFSSLTAWLLGEIDSEFIEWNQFDDPNSISNSIYDQLKRMQFAADFPVSKLRHGSGDAVCLALNFLLDRVLAKKSFQVLPPIYINPESAEDAEVDEDAELDEEDMEEDVEEDENDGLFTAEEYFAGPKVEKDPDELELQQVLESTVDPAEWKLELERVGPRLKFRAQPLSKEWRTHIEQSGKHEEQITKIFPETKTALGKVGKELRAAVDRISSKERSINKDFDHLGGEFRDKQKKLDEIQERYNELSQSVSELTQSLSEKTESVQLIKQQMDDRHQSMTNNTPLRRIGDALKDLRKEVDTMELRIGVVGQTLMQSKLKMATESHMKKRRQEESRY